jgi:integrase
MTMRPSGHIRQRSPGSFEVRYNLGTDPATGRRRTITTTIKGSRKDAEKELRRLLRTVDVGDHVAPDKITLAVWAEHWISIGCPGQRRRKVGQPSQERYAQLLRLYVLPVLGGLKLQRLSSADIESLYAGLEKRLAARTLHFLHCTLGACIGAAVRSRRLARNPIADMAVTPSPGTGEHGKALEPDQLQALLQGFKGTVYFPIVAVAAFTGARRNEILALRWSDLNVAAKTLRIERAIELTETLGLTIKPPKTNRGFREITIDDDLIALLIKERERHLRIAAGVPDGVDVDLSLVKLPPGALMFPNPSRLGKFSFTGLRHPNNITKEFARKAAAIGFPGLRFHDLRGTHETLLLDKGVGIHVVARRCGHDPAVMLRKYAKRLKSADEKAAEALVAISKTALR